MPLCDGAVQRFDVCDLLGDGRRRRPGQGGGRRPRASSTARHHALKDLNDPDRRAAGDRADRPVGLRQEHVPALLQPHARPAAGDALRGQHHAASGRHEPRRAAASTRSRCACASAWCSRSRIRSRSRSSRTSPTGCGCAASRKPRDAGTKRVEKALRGAALWDEVKDRLQRLGARAVRRPDAAPVHRARARRRSRRSCCSTSRPRRSIRSRPRRSRS